MTQHEKQEMVDENHELKTQLEELRLKSEKADAQMRIARMALFAMIAVMAFLLSPWAPSVELLAALDATLATFMVACASIVGAFMGFTTWLTRR